MRDLKFPNAKSSSHPAPSIHSLCLSRFGCLPFHLKEDSFTSPPPMPDSLSLAFVLIHMLCCPPRWTNILPNSVPWKHMHDQTSECRVCSDWNRWAGYSLNDAIYDVITRSPFSYSCYSTQNLVMYEWQLFFWCSRSTKNICRTHMELCKSVFGTYLVPL